MISLVNSHTNATRIGWHLWEIDLRFAPGLPPGWVVDLLRARSSSAALLLAMLGMQSEVVRVQACREAGPPNHHDDKVDSDQ